MISARGGVPNCHSYLQQFIPSLSLKGIFRGSENRFTSQPELSRENRTWLKKVQGEKVRAKRWMDGRKCIWNDVHLFICTLSVSTQIAANYHRYILTSASIFAALISPLQLRSIAQKAVYISGNEKSFMQRDAFVNIVLSNQPSVLHTVHIVHTVSVCSVISSYPSCLNNRRQNASHATFQRSDSRKPNRRGGFYLCKAIFCI